MRTRAAAFGFGGAAGGIFTVAFVLQIESRVRHLEIPDRRGQPREECPPVRREGANAATWCARTGKHGRREVYLEGDVRPRTDASREELWEAGFSQVNSVDGLPYPATALPRQPPAVLRLAHDAVVVAPRATSSTAWHVVLDVAEPSEENGRLSHVLSRFPFADAPKCLGLVGRLY